MRENNSGRTQEILSMEEYLARRQEKRRVEILREPAGKARRAEVNAVLELAQMYV